MFSKEGYTTFDATIYESIKGEDEGLCLLMLNLKNCLLVFQ
jgi:hypothetical protein